MPVPKLRAWRSGLAERPGYPGILLAAALFGLFTTNFNVSVLAVVIPDLIDEFDTTANVISWVVVGPMLAFAVLGPMAGKLGDLFGRRRVYLVGLLGCCAFAGLTALAQGALPMVLLRSVSATFGSVTAPAAMAIISEHFPRERRVQALGYWGLVLAGGPVLGMMVGGPVAEQFGWRWLFIVQVPLTLVGFVVALAVLPVARRLPEVHFDVAGTLLLAVAAGGFVFAVNRGPSWGWTSPVLLLLFVLVPLAGTGFVLQERRSAHPLIPVEYFRRRNFAAPMAGQFLVNVSYQGGFVVVPLMLAEVLGYRPGRIALVTLARPLFYGLAGPVAGRLAMRVGERRTAVVGALGVALSTLLLTTVGVGTSDVAIFAVLALAGAGLGGMVPPLMATVTTAVEDRDLGVAGATSQMTLQIGTAVGIQLFQTVQETREAHGVELAASYHNAFLVGSAFALVGAFMVSLVRSMDRSPGPGAPPEPSRRPPAPTAGRAAAQESAGVARATKRGTGTL